MKVFLGFVLALLFGLLPEGLPAQSDTGTQILVIGTHFLPHDIHRSARQKEAEDLSASLLRFQPAAVAMEVSGDAAFAEKEMEDYRGFLQRVHIPDRSVSEQLGFRIAAAMNHPAIFPIQDPVSFDLGSAFRDLRAGDLQRGSFLEQARAIEVSKQQHAGFGTLSYYLAFLNSPANLQYEQGIYLRGLTGIAAEGDFQGADLLTKWYGHHIRLLAGLHKLSDQVSGPILLFVASSKVPILKELIQADPAFVWVEPSGYLQLQ